ncbi:MAG: hypothetical protein ABI472_00275 [Ginsengibacter sp.]
MNFQTMNKQRKFVLLASAVGVIAMFLPWVSFLGYTVNGMHGSGIFVFLCFVASGIVAGMGEQTKNLDSKMWAITLIAGTIALLIILYFFSEASGSGSIFGSVAGFGMYLSGIAAIGVLLSAYLFRAATDNLKDSFNSMKKGFENKINTPENTTTHTTDAEDKMNNPGNTNLPV